MPADINHTVALGCIEMSRCCAVAQACVSAMMSEGKEKKSSRVTLEMVCTGLSQLRLGGSRLAGRVRTGEPLITGR